MRCALPPSRRACTCAGWLIASATVTTVSPATSNQCTQPPSAAIAALALSIAKRQRWPRARSSAVNQSALPSADQRSGALTAWSQAPVSTCQAPPRSSTAALAGAVWRRPMLLARNAIRRPSGL